MDHQSGNITGLFIAEEATLGALPAQPVWVEREPNSYADFGGNYAMTTRKPITHDRQYRKGEVSDNNPTAGWNEDLTPNNLVPLMQGFLYADAREKPTTKTINGSGTERVITGVTATDYTAAAGMGVFVAGAIVLATGFTDPNNNGINVVTASASGTVTMASPLEVEAGPVAGAVLRTVGHQFASGDVALTLTDASVVLTSAAFDMSTLGLTLGEFIFVGGDSTTTRFADSGDNAPFYGRVIEIDPDFIRLDETTGVQAANAGTGKTLQIFFGTVVRNEEDCDLMKQRSWHMERQYGCGTGFAGADYVAGAVPNQITVTVPTPGADAKVTLDFGFIATRSFERDAVEGILAGDRIDSLNEPAYKPGIDVYRNRFAVIDPVTLNPLPLVAYNQDMTLVVNNNAAGNKAIETFGNFSVNVGELGVTGSATSYWNGVEVTRRVRQGADINWNLILTKKNTAIVFEIASLGFGNGRANVAANTPVTLPLDTAAGKGQFGYTLLTTFLHYVPAVGMANQ